GISSLPRVTLLEKPVIRSAAVLARATRSGSSRTAWRLGFVLAPAHLAARSAARTESPFWTIARASFRRPSWSGTASTARAPPSLAGGQLPAARGARANEHGLDDALRADRFRETVLRIGVEPLAQLARIRMNRVDGKLQQLAWSGATEENFEALAQALAVR